MKVFDRLKMGIVLTKDSLAVIRHYPRLILFPALSGLAGLAFLGVFLGVTFGASQLEPEGGVLVGLFLLYLGLTFISSFFYGSTCPANPAVIRRESRLAG